MAENIVINLSGDAELKLKGLAGQIQNFEVRSTSSFNKAAAAFSVFSGVLGANAVQKILGTVTDSARELFNTFVTEGVAAAQQQEDAQNRLNQALAQSGEYSLEAAQDMEAFASALQAQTKYGDEAILETSALIQSLGQLDREGLKGATQAALDLAAALKIDLNSAATLVGKAATGEIGAFSRYGLAIKKGATDAETFANALNAINSKFGGRAAADVNTYSGAVAQAANAFSDIQEEAGFGVIRTQALVAVIKEASSIFAELSGSVKGNRSELNALVKDGLILAIDATAALVVALDTFGRVGRVAFGVVTAPVYGLGAAISGVLSLVNDDMNSAFQEFSRKADEAMKAVMSAEEPTALLSVNDALARLRGAAEQSKHGSDALTDALGKQSEQAALAKERAIQLADAQIKLGDEGRKLAEQVAMEADPALKYEKDILALEAAYAQKKIMEEEYNAANDELYAQYEEKVSARYEKEAQDLFEQNQRLRDIDGYGNAARIAENNKTLSTIVKNEDLNAKSREKIQRQLTAEQNRIDQDRLNALSGTFSQVTAMTAKNTAAYKTAATAETIISTYSGASKAAEALAGIPVVGPALAAAAVGIYIASGLARVAQIQGVQLAGGIDEVPGIGTRDNFPAILAPGERVVPRETNKDLKTFLAGDGPMVGLLQSIDAKLSALQQQIIVNVGSREIVNEIRSALDSGRAFA